MLACKLNIDCDLMVTLSERGKVYSVAVFKVLLAVICSNL